MIGLPDVNVLVALAWPNHVHHSTELLWQCPQRHEWNTFIEERNAPAKENLKSDV